MVGAEPVTEYIGRQRFKWFGNSMHMPWNQPALRAYNMHSSGYKTRGGCRKRWIKSVKKQTEHKKISMAEATQLTIRKKGFLHDAS